MVLNLLFIVLYSVPCVFQLLAELSNIDWPGLVQLCFVPWAYHQDGILVHFVFWLSVYWFFFVTVLEILKLGHLFDIFRILWTDPLTQYFAFLDEFLDGCSFFSSVNQWRQSFLPDAFSICSYFFYETEVSRLLCIDLHDTRLEYFPSLYTQDYFFPSLKFYILLLVNLSSGTTSEASGFTAKFWTFYDDIYNQ
jgi:hypothetical protein